MDEPSLSAAVEAAYHLKLTPTLCKLHTAGTRVIRSGSLVSPRSTLSSPRVGGILSRLQAAEDALAAVHALSLRLREALRFQNVSLLESLLQQARAGGFSSTQLFADTETLVCNAVQTGNAAADAVALQDSVRAGVVLDALAKLHVTAAELCAGYQVPPDATSEAFVGFVAAPTIAALRALMAADPLTPRMQEVMRSPRREPSFVLPFTPRSSAEPQTSPRFAGLASPAASDVPLGKQAMERMAHAHKFMKVA
jgi:hypothetical protein